MGCKLVVCRDEAGDFARIRARLIPAKHAGDRLLANIKHKRRRLSEEEASEYFRLLRAKQLMLQRPRVRKRIARHAAQCRWAKRAHSATIID
jgi:hypothetical protein